MPGFSKQRFVGLSENEDEELTCGICLEIFNKPMVVQCCRQTYCNDCITEWLRDNNSCPNDRQNLTVEKLIEPPRLVQNLISKLRIHCKNQNSGCDSIIPLENLEDHEASCYFNPDHSCGICKLDVIPGEEHDCITHLLAMNLSLVDEISRLRKEIPKNESSNEELTIASAREWINSGKQPEVTRNSGFSPVLLTKVKSIINVAVLNYSTFADISRVVNEKICECEDGTWHVIVYVKGYGESLVRPSLSDYHYLDLSFGEIRFEIYLT